MASESSRLKIEVGNFLVAVRAGPADRRRIGDTDDPGPERRQDLPAADVGLAA